MKIKFFNLWMDNCTNLEILSFVRHLNLINTCSTLFFVNAHCFNLAQSDEYYKNILNNSNILLNDGIGMDIAATMLNTKFYENLNGTDLIPKILEIASENKYKVYILGGLNDVAKKATEEIRSKFPNITITGYHDGYFNSDQEKNIIDEINHTETDIIIVGMGVPIQEKWIWENKHKFNTVKLCIAGGAILDFISGRIQRAPIFLQKMKFEWVFRLLLEPGRMYKRYLIGNFVFFINLFKLKFVKDNNTEEFNPVDLLQNILVTAKAMEDKQSPASIIDESNEQKV